MDSLDEMDSTERQVLNNITKNSIAFQKRNQGALAIMQGLENIPINYEDLSKTELIKLFFIKLKEWLRQ